MVFALVCQASKSVANAGGRSDTLQGIHIVPVLFFTLGCCLQGRGVGKVTHPGGITGQQKRPSSDERKNFLQGTFIKSRSELLTGGGSDFLTLRPRWIVTGLPVTWSGRLLRPLTPSRGDHASAASASEGIQECSTMI